MARNNINNKTGICFFYYNRPELVSGSILSLVNSKNYKKFDIYFFVDGAVDQNDAIKTNQVISEINILVNKFNIDVEIIINKKNKGLANSILSGLNHAFSKNSSVIVFEDDILFLNNTLDYFQESLEKYYYNNSIGSISGFSFPIKRDSHSSVFLHPRPTSWGWATWRDRWENVVWDIDEEYLTKVNYNPYDFNKLGHDMNRMLISYINGNNNSWAIRWALHHYLNNIFAVTPFSPFCSNIGFGKKSSTHTKTKNYFLDHIDIESSNTEFFLEDNLYIDKKLISKVNIYNSNFSRIIQNFAPGFLWILYLKLIYKI